MQKIWKKTQVKGFPNCLRDHIRRLRGHFETDLGRYLQNYLSPGATKRQATRPGLTVFAAFAAALRGGCADG
jgi:hypothetical protein